jgi:copper chaperone CopZ
MPNEKNHICDLDEYLNFDTFSNTKITGNSANLNPADINLELNKLNIKISGMTCAGCASGVQSILQSLNGVIEAKVNYPEGTGEIIYNPKIISKEQIISSDAFLTYPATIVSDEKLNS